jgi:hypothetical protein
MHESDFVVSGEPLTASKRTHDHHLAFENGERGIASGARSLSFDKIVSIAPAKPARFILVTEILSIRNASIDDGRISPYVLC